MKSLRLNPVLSILFLSLLEGGSIQAEEVLSAGVHDALAGALSGNSQRVSSIRSMVEKDTEKDPEHPTGIADDLAVLEVVSDNTTREEKGKELKKLAGKMNDPVARERLLNLASRVPEVEIKDLTRKRKVNRMTGFFNRAWETTSEVVTGQPRALAVAGTDAFFAVTGRGKASVVDKKIAYLARIREAGGEATEEEIQQGREIVAQIEEKKSRTLLKSWKDSVKQSAKAGEVGRTTRLCRIGTTLWPEEKAWFDEHTPLPPAPSLEGKEEPSGSSREEDPRGMLLRRKLTEAESEPETLSVDPAREPIGEAMAGRRSKTLNYMLFGETGFGINAHGVARSVAAQGSDAPANLGILQGAQTVLRGVTLLWGNDLGLEEAIEAYAEVDRKTPGALTEDDIRDWADLCAKAGRFRDGLDVLESHNIKDEKREYKYRSKWGKAILKRCEDLPAGGDRFEALKFVIKNMPDTPAAQKAQRLLAETPSSEKPLVQVKREDLCYYESLLDQAGLSLKKEWWDGDKSNGEIGEEGIFWDKEGIVWFRVDKGSAWRSLPQDPTHLTTLQGAFTRVEDLELARNLANIRGESRKFPLELEGALGPESSYMTPKFVQYDVEKDDEGLFQ